jgi:hypothetical protein
MFRRFKLVFAGLAIIAGNQAVSYAVSAAAPQSLLAAGTSRYAVVSTTSTATTTSGSWGNLPGLSAAINIPVGKHGDVLIFFCGDSTTQSITQVRAKVGTLIAAPGSAEIRYNPPASGAETRCANFYKTGVASGSMAVSIQWASTPGQNSLMFSRSMIVIVNIH